MAEGKSGVRTAVADDNGGLLRQLGVPSATALVVSNMIGTGIFVAPAFLAGDLARVDLIFLVWTVGAVCALAGAFCYAELGVNLPSSGGEYVYLTHAYGPAWGFMTGWVSFLAGFSAPIAATSLAFADYLGYFFPAVKQENAALIAGSGDWTFRFGGAQIVACTLVGLLTLLNLFGVQRVAKFQNVFTGLKIAVVAAFIFLGFSAGTGNWQYFQMEAIRTSTTPLMAQFAISLFWIYGSYSGWNAATYVAEEIKRPERTLPIALTFGTILVAVLYMGLNAVFIFGAGLEQMKGVIAVGSFTASRLFGPGVAGLFGAVMALALVSTVNAMVTIGPRVYYAMAKNRAFFSSAAKVDPRWHTPRNAILWQGLVSILLTFTSIPALFLYIGITLNLTAGLAVASLFFFRKRPNWRKLPVVDFAWPLMPCIFLLISVWSFAFGVTLRPAISIGTVLTVATGALFYKFRIARN